MATKMTPKAQKIAETVFGVVAIFNGYDMPIIAAENVTIQDTFNLLRARASTGFADAQILAQVFKVTTLDMKKANEIRASHGAPMF